MAAFSRATAFSPRPGSTDAIAPLPAAHRPRERRESPRGITRRGCEEWVRIVAAIGESPELYGFARWNSQLTQRRDRPTASAPIRIDRTLQQRNSSALLECDPSDLWPTSARERPNFRTTREGSQSSRQSSPGMMGIPIGLIKKDGRCIENLPRGSRRIVSSGPLGGRCKSAMVAQIGHPLTNIDQIAPEERALEFATLRNSKRIHFSFALARDLQCPTYYR